MFKNLLKYIIISIITLEARLVLFRYRPRIIAISGTVGKTTTKDLVFQVLNSELKVRKTRKSLNSEIGIPLTILGHSTGWTSPLSWIKIIWSGFCQIIYTPNYPDWLVIETGIDRPGDMDRIAKMLKPEIVIITAFGAVPAHVEYFESPDDVMKEEAKLMNYIRENGSLILNADDEDVLKLKSKSKVKTYTYGIKNDRADMLATNSNINYPGPSGISFKINNEGNVIPITINNVLGDQYIYPSMAALTAGKILGISPATSAESINKFVPAPGRMNLIKGKNKSIIIDDTYNASPLAMHKALETFERINCEGYKIAILGDMLEIGRFSHSEHEKVGAMVADFKIDFLITIGIRAEDIGKSAATHGMAKKKIFILKDLDEATDVILDLLIKKEGSAVLAKGSQGVRVEKLVRRIIDNPEKAGKLLVRQEKEWQER